ncbi:unnamed protein product [Anisakis simplex]|uniref:G_PROTEIN_RECEP_F1_2 domain-containing protein n=1 Tax=Anisakis simplex TaxID=6269 RepID=A0A158PP60_ANISI|nr:unnamed protein product [Anisakis simplex]
MSERFAFRNPEKRFLRFQSNYRRHVIIAARLMCYKTSLTIADLIVLFIYAPTQIIWISTYYVSILQWYGGDVLCRATKFINTFSLHLTANMQVLIAADRLYITAHLRKVHQRSRCSANQLVFAAWVLAIACALPQLVVFHASNDTPNGEPQCVSIWTIMRYHRHIAHSGGSYDDESELNSTNHSIYKIARSTLDNGYNETENDYDNILSSLEHGVLANYCPKSLRYPHSMTLTLPSYCADTIPNGENRNVIEKSDNVAEVTGHSRKFGVGLPAVSQRNEMSDAKNRLFNISSSRAGSLVPLSLRDLQVSKIVRRHFGSLPADCSASNSFENCSGDDPTKHAPLMTASSQLSSDELQMYRKQLMNAFRNGHRKSAWQITMSIARRRTRMKAFLMLTLNMIFWTPYCVLGILSTLTVFDHTAYDFVNAFVVLNAVSNLLL